MSVTSIHKGLFIGCDPCFFEAELTMGNILPSSSIISQAQSQQEVKPKIRKCVFSILPPLLSVLLPLFCDIHTSLLCRSLHVAHQDLSFLSRYRIFLAPITQTPICLSLSLLVGRDSLVHCSIFHGHLERVSSVHVPWEDSQKGFDKTWR